MAEVEDDTGEAMGGLGGGEADVETGDRWTAVIRRGSVLRHSASSRSRAAPEQQPTLPWPRTAGGPA